MSKNRTISVQGKDITIFSQNEDDFISLTDMVRSQEDGDQLIKRWLSLKNTIEYLGVWERWKNGENFNLVEFDQIRNAAGSNKFTLSVKKWCEQTGAIGIKAKTGRYGSGTYGHHVVYCGRTGDLSTRFNAHHKEDEIKKHNTNCLCVMAVGTEKERDEIERDILGCGTKFPCNDLLN